MRREICTRLGAGEHRVAVFCFQVFTLGARPHDDLGSWQVQGQERLDILLDRHATDIEEDGSRQALEHVGIVRAAGLEDLCVDAARPGRDVAKSVLGQFVAHGGRGDHQPARGLMEPLHIGVAGRQRQPRRDVFREPRVIAGGEG